MPDISESLLQAVRDGDIESVKGFIDSYGLSYSSAWSGGYNLLLDALICEHREIAELLLIYGSKVNGKTKNAHTPLHFAVINDDVEIVKMLLHRNAKVGVRGDDNETPLYCAHKKGNPEVIKLLLEKDPRILRKDACGITPLHIAAQLGDVEMVEHFLEETRTNSCALKATTRERLTPLYLATKNGHERVVKLLLHNGAEADDRDKNGQTVLQLAVEKGHRKIVEMLQYGFTRNTEDQNDFFEKRLTDIRRKKEENNKLLLGDGANGDVCNKHRGNTLNSSAGKGDSNIVEVLLEFGKKEENKKLLLSEDANGDVCDKHRGNRFQSAVGKGYAKIVESLLECNGAVKSTDEHGQKPFHDSTGFYHNIPVVEIHLNHDADIDIDIRDKSDKIDKTALVDSDKGSRPVDTVLEEHMTKIEVANRRVDEENLRSICNGLDTVEDDSDSSYETEDESSCSEAEEQSKEKKMKFIPGEKKKRKIKKKRHPRRDRTKRKPMGTKNKKRNQR